MKQALGALAGLGVLNVLLAFPYLFLLTWLGSLWLGAVGMLVAGLLITGGWASHSVFGWPSLDNIVVNDSGVAVKPWGPPAHLDFAVYKTHAATAWDGMGLPLELLAQWWGHGWGPALVWLQEQPLKPGPVYPALIQSLGYAQHQGLMASVYMVLGAVLGWAWAWWARAQGAGLGVQLVLAGFPALVYYAFVVSTDLLFAVIMAGFYGALLLAVRGSRSAL
jgi:hypothetical protein